MVYPHFLKFLCNVELENVFPLLAKEFGCRLQATPGQAKEEAMGRDAEPFAVHPAGGYCFATPPKLTWLPQEQCKEAEVCFRGPT